LASLRKDRSNYIDALNKKEPFAIFQPKNNFAGFHIRNLFGKILERIRNYRSKETNWSPQKIVASAYGGFFFNKKLLNTIGLPNDEYILYHDDFDFTYRITLKGGDIWLIPSSIIKDIEASYYLQLKKPLLFHSVFDAKTDAIVYYSFRNMVFFSNNFLIENRLMSQVNKFFFWLLIGTIGIIRNKVTRLQVLKDACTDAKKGALGSHSKYRLSN
jgi:GT2 family glycosyltransferase